MHVHLMWGKVRREQPIGYVADFCPICRNVKAFRLLADRVSWHIYHIRLGPGKLLGHIGVCLACGIRISAKVSDFKAVAAVLPQRLEELVAESFPDVYSAYGGRLRTEEHIRQDPHSFTAEDRMRLIREPFNLLAPIFEHKCKSGPELDRKNGTGCLLTIAVPVVLMILAGKAGLSEEAYDRFVWPVFWLAVAGGAATTIYFFATANRRFLKSYVMPILVRGLRPLKPASGEIDLAIESLRSAKFRLGKKLKASAVMEALTLPEIEPGHEKNWAGSTTAVTCPGCGTQNSVAGHWESDRPVCRKCLTYL